MDSLKMLAFKEDAEQEAIGNEIGNFLNLRVVKVGLSQRWNLDSGSKTGKGLLLTLIRMLDEAAIDGVNAQIFKG